MLLSHSDPASTRKNTNANTGKNTNSDTNTNTITKQVKTILTFYILTFPSWCQLANPNMLCYVFSGVLGKLGPRQLGPGQLGPVQLGPGHLGPRPHLSGAQFATFSGRTVGPRTTGPRAQLEFGLLFFIMYDFVCNSSWHLNVWDGVH